MGLYVHNIGIYIYICVCVSIYIYIYVLIGRQVCADKLDSKTSCDEICTQEAEAKAWNGKCKGNEVPWKGRDCSRPSKCSTSRGAAMGIPNRYAKADPRLAWWMGPKNHWMFFFLKKICQGQFYIKFMDSWILAAKCLRILVGFPHRLHLGLHHQSCWLVQVHMFVGLIHIFVLVTILVDWNPLKPISNLFEIHSTHLNPIKSI